MKRRGHDTYNSVKIILLKGWLANSFAMRNKDKGTIAICS
jgi:hypothetical protein